MENFVGRGFLLYPDLPRWSMTIQRVTRLVSVVLSTKSCSKIELLVSRLVQKMQFSVQVINMLMVVAKRKCVLTFIAPLLSIGTSRTVELGEESDWHSSAGLAFSATHLYRRAIFQQVKQQRNESVRLV
jgi:DNA polymerase III psi subunit